MVQCSLTGILPLDSMTQKIQCEKSFSFLYPKIQEHYCFTTKISVYVGLVPIDLFSDNNTLHSKKITIFFLGSNFHLLVKTTYFTSVLTMTNPSLPFIPVEDGPGTNLINGIREMKALEVIVVLLEEIQENIVWLINHLDGTYFVDNFLEELRNWLSFVVQDLTPGKCYKFFNSIPSNVKKEVERNQLLKTTMCLINHDILWNFNGVYWGLLTEIDHLTNYLQSLK